MTPSDPEPAAEAGARQLRRLPRARPPRSGPEFRGGMNLGSNLFIGLLLFAMSAASGGLGVRPGLALLVSIGVTVLLCRMHAGSVVLQLDGESLRRRRAFARPILRRDVRGWWATGDWLVFRMASERVRLVPLVILASEERARLGLALAEHGYPRGAAPGEPAAARTAQRRTLLERVGLVALVGAVALGGWIGWL